MNTETEKITVPEFLTLFKKFSAKERLQIAERISRQTFEARWKMLDAELPEVEISDEEIMNEVRAVRDGKKPKVFH
jgi:hypothetical protein